MKLKKLIAIGLATVLTFSLVGCGSKDSKKDTKETATKTESTKSSDDASASKLDYQKVVFGETGKDLSTTIKFFSHKTDLKENGTYDKLIAKFNETYPNIKVEVEATTTYADDALLRLTSDNWGDIMMIPAVDKNELSKYFMPYGTYDQLSTQYNYITNWMYKGDVYGMPSAANAQGIVYNKKVFTDAGITSIPKTPDEFIAALQAIKDKTKAIPLYTNYAAGWTLGAWDAYIGGSATGDADFQNRVLPYQKDPFADRKDGTGPYALYKILYDAVNKGLTEEDYTTTDWEGCKGMINKGEIGCMALGSWAVSQMQAAGDNGADIGYMSFPISVNGTQYATAGPDYCYGINAKSSDDNKLASELFVKFMVEQSGLAFSEGSLPIVKSDTKLPELFSAFQGVEFVVDTPAEEGKEDILNQVNTESELMINAGGNTKVAEIIEHAANKDESFDDIMADWNQKWSDAQDSVGVDVTK
ncbi:ABC transporter substrate-binding protein [Anaeromicropila herbilytica]|uniref:Sugar ABC transporter substrate-binding protein n=1 Tax=Anaeromicropila herbilytica TaxID=2785025 RepID=A0A7R7ENL1_9FIRM|nr:ABC transporter substrate-binding protein [Anaeromicropila herbilytica]BCN32112.1 sugar ABC transporter substrate-binding protein [Anaeromicropila herbilytica]